VDPGRDVVGIYFSIKGYIPSYGEDAPENRVKVQIPSDETQFGWMNMSRYCQTTLVRRNGPINDLVQIRMGC